MMLSNLSLRAAIGLAAVLLISLTVACSGDSEDVAEPTSQPATPSATAVTEQALLEIGELIFPQAGENIFVVCGGGGDLSACPVTERLAKRLRDARATLCRCQNSSTTRTMTATPGPNGGTIRVSLYEGSHVYDLTVVTENGRLLVDDQVCAGQGQATSIYVTLELCSTGSTGATPTPVAQAPGTPVPPALTGIKNVDRAVEAVLNADAFQLASLFHLEAKGCTTAVGLGGPPQCRTGEAPGTTVHVLYTSSCDGHYIRQDETASLAGRFVEDKGRLAGVYKHNGLLFPSSQYVVVFSFETPYGSLARILFVSDPGIVGVTFGCGTSAKEYVETLGLRDPVFLPGG